MKKIVVAVVVAMVVAVAVAANRMGMVQRQTLMAPVAWTTEAVARARAAVGRMVDDLTRPVKDTADNFEVILPPDSWEGVATITLGKSTRLSQHQGPHATLLTGSLTDRPNRVVIRSRSGGLGQVDCGAVRVRALVGHGSVAWRDVSVSNAHAINRHVCELTLSWQEQERDPSGLATRN